MMSAKYGASLGLKSLYEGKSNTVRVQVVNKWKEFNFRTTDRIKSIDMLFNDEEGDELHASIPEELIWKFDDAIKENSLYSIQGLHLSKSKTRFRPARSEKRGLFCRDTRITELDTDPTAIIPRRFKFTEFEEINSNIQNIYLTDVIGYLRAYTSIRSFRRASGQSNLMREITLENLRGSTINIALWGNACKEVENNPAFTTYKHNPILLGVCSTYVKNYQGII
ncbi:hypothetical protein MKW92_044387 [Papaver armeniacum]|nr:hypothetical protein MKW92_044387 [Papaver armeniacum]